MVCHFPTSSVLFRSQRGYDAASNVTAVNTTLSVGGTAGTDNQAFCYDEQNRLTWAGSTGTPSCGASLTAGTLTTASYTQAFSYDTLDRLTSSALGTYDYSDASHLHAVSSINSDGDTTRQYSALYDAAGNLQCRAADGSTCPASPTSAVLGYDNEGRLTTWQNAPSSPTTTDGFLYDGAGNRVEQLVTVNGSITTTTTYVAGGLEESTSNAVGTTLTKYFSGASGLPTAERVGTNGPLSYLASDGQGTVSTSLDSAGNVTSQQLYTPYGNARYSSGSSPTSFGYTGQRADSSTGLDYYNARYYDPVAGQFASADMVADGLNRYSYVGGNPTTATDPTGHRLCLGDTPNSCVPNPRPPTPTPTTCRSDGSCGCYAICTGSNDGSGDCGPATNGGGSAGGFALLLSCGDDRTRTKDGIPNDALWGKSDPKGRFTLWLSYPEEDTAHGGWHLNLHVETFNSGHAVHNFHIYFIGDVVWDFGSYKWSAHDFIKGELDTPEETFASVSWVEDPAAQQAAFAMQEYIMAQAQMGDEPTNFFLTKKSGMLTALAEGLRMLSELPKKTN